MMGFEEIDPLMTLAACVRESLGSAMVLAANCERKQATNYG
jgi:hypothetical protein